MNLSSDSVDGPSSILDLPDEILTCIIGYCPFEDLRRIELVQLWKLEFSSGSMHLNLRQLRRRLPGIKRLNLLNYTLGNHGRNAQKSKLDFEQRVKQELTAIASFDDLQEITLPRNCSKAHQDVLAIALAKHTLEPLRTFTASPLPQLSLPLMEAMPKSLRALHLNWAAVNGKSFQVICQLTRLTRLEMVNHRVTDSEFESLTNLQALRIVDLSCPSKLHAEACFKVVAQLPKLTMLTATRLLPSDLPASLTELKPLASHLTHLDISDAKTFCGFEALRAFGKLRELNVSHSNITHLDLEHIAVLTQLERLNVRMCTKIASDSALQLLIKALNQLKYIALYGTSYHARDLISHRYIESDH